MRCSPRQSFSTRTWLYRNRRAAVILALVGGCLALWAGAQALHAQELAQKYSRKDADKGPRAVGLIQLSSTGKARVVPIVIMMDGKFYDASSYKAAPVPMALDFGVVYEAFKTGVSQGTVTINQPGQLNHNWIAEGSWLPAGMKSQSDKTRKYAPPVIEDDRKDDRPTLHRRAGGAADDNAKDDKDKDKDKDSAKPASNSGDSSATSTQSTSSPSPSAGSSSSGSTSSGSSSGTSASGTSSSGASSSASTASSPASGTAQSASKDSGKDAAKSPTLSTRAAAADEPIDDPNRPRLRRGKPDPNAHHEPFVNFDEEEPAKSGTPAASATAPAAKDAAPTVQTFTAVSDAGGPDPRPYTYDLKPAEEAIYRNKMLAMAATLVKLKPGASAAQAPSTAAAHASATHKTAAAKTTPQFEDLKLRIFDLSNSNEPVLILSARTSLPQQRSSASSSGSSSGSPSGSQVPQEITLVARTNLEGELQKLYFAQTDSRHLDVSPRMELIDAVDVDGDGRGELLFRLSSDNGSGYAIYRVTADQLWPLYESAL